ncbi:hypothetical protein NKH71_31535 [Mesorhizobium sp. M0983]|uniref:hypothetical protein n=1 Tax=Mesorhizobium sp. M0983 TaxID=2957040 RepID=UPI0033365B15
MGQEYAREKFVTAMSSLVSPGDIRKRLEGAYMSFHPVQAKDVKGPEMATQYKVFMSRLTTVKASNPQQGPICMPRSIR